MTPLGKERLEGFQRALAATCRAIAHKPALSVSFRAAEGRGLGRQAEAQGSGRRASEPPGLQLPPPRRAMAAQDVARLRGEADGAALRLRHHNAKLHHRLAPHGEVAEAIFGALEQVRVEALGAQRMLGVAANLASAHAARHRRAPGTPGDEQADLAAALELYAQESLLGFHLPREQRAQLDDWRPWLESRTGEDWSDLRTHLAHQEAFALRVRELLAHLGLAEEFGEEPEDPDSEQDETQEEEQPSEDGKGKVLPRPPSARRAKPTPSPAPMRPPRPGRASDSRTRQLMAPTTARAATRRSRHPSTFRRAARRSPIACSPPGSTR